MRKLTGAAGMPKLEIMTRFQMLVTRISPMAEPI
jgi:hypothetical protein